MDAEPPRLAELATLMRRPGVLVLFTCGFALAIGQALALAQVGGAVSRLGWGFAFGDRLPWSFALLLALVAGVGASGWVGLYLTLVAEIGGARHGGLLTGVAVMFTWSGVLVGPMMFGLGLDAVGGYAVPWLLLAMIAAAYAVSLGRLRRLVQRGAVPEPTETTAPEGGRGARAGAQG